MSIFASGGLYSGSGPCHDNPRSNMLMSLHTATRASYAAAWVSGSFYGTVDLAFATFVACLQAVAVYALDARSRGLCIALQ
jgi:hypothetical protein